MPQRRRRTAVAVALGTVVVALVAACSSGGGGRPSPTPSASPGPSLPDLSRARGIAWGAGVNEHRMDRPRYQELVTDNFTSITPENAFKWERTEPAQGKFDFTEADALVDFAAKNHLRVRACCLAWYFQNPPWLKQQNFTKAELAAILRNHIRTEVGHFKGRVAQWDVVNEAFHTAADGTLQPFQYAWTKALGMDYVKQAFRWAHEADPDALLFYNENGNDGPGAHFDAVYKLVSEMKREGVPIHGVGMEMHRGFGHPTPKEVYDAMQKYAALGLRVEITEMDVPLDLKQDSTSTPLRPADLQRQALTYRQMTATCLRVQACTGMTFWGVDDNDRYQGLISRRRGAMTMFDAEGNRKPAYNGVVAALMAAEGPRDRPSPGKPAG